MRALGVGWAGLRHRPGPWLLLATAMVIAGALPVVAAGLQAESSVAAVRAAVSQVPPTARAVLAVTGQDLRGAERQQADAAVRRSYAEIGLAPPRQLLAFRPVSAGSTEFVAVATNSPEQTAKLTSGRAPATCTPTRCEVLAVPVGGPDGQPAAADEAVTRGAAALGLVVTGTAVLSDPLLVGTGLVTVDQTLLLGSDPEALAELESLALFGRSTAWQSPLDADAVLSRGVDGFATRLNELVEEVNVSTGPLSVSWPQEAVVAAAGRSAQAAGRFPLLGAGAAVLQLGFALVTAAGLRRRHLATARLLLRRGASNRQLVATVLWPALLATSLGLVGGALLAAAGVGFRLGLLDRAVVGAAGQALVSALPALVALGLGAMLLTTATCSWPATAARGARLALDGALVVGVLGLGWLLANATGPLAVSLLVWVVVLSGLLAARLWTPVFEAWCRSRSPSGRAALRAPALLGTRRRPLLSMVTAGFLAGACCSLVMAGGYRASFQQSSSDQASAAVPLDVRITPSGQVVAPLPTIPVADLADAAPNASIWPVTSTAVTIFAGSPEATALPLVGLDPDVLPQLHDFAATTGTDQDPAELARRLRAPAGEQPATVIPAGTTRIGLQVSGLPNGATISLWLADGNGGQQQVRLLGTGASMAARLEPGPERVLTAIELAETFQQVTVRQHGVGEGDTDRPQTGGTVRLGALSADGASLQEGWAGWGSDRAKVVPDQTGLRVEFRIAGPRVVLVPDFSALAGAEPLPVVVDTATAARAGVEGRLGLTVSGLTVPAQVVAVLPRLPRLPGQRGAFVLADRRAATAVLDRVAPGTAFVEQVWIASPDDQLAGVRTALSNSAAATATVAYRADVREALASDPVAVRTVWLLTAAGLVALLLALVAVATTVRAGREESAADAFALELNGVRPAVLRAGLFGTTVGLLVVSVPVGLIGGVAGAYAVVPLLAAGADGSVVEPPLQVVVATGGVLGPVAILAAGCLAVAAAVAATQFRSGRLRQPETETR